MNELNIRFIEFYNYLILHNIVKSAKDMAQNLDISGSLITEIVKGRSIVGTKAIQNSVLVYNLNSDWFFTGKGPMLKNEINPVEKKDIQIIEASSMSFILDRLEALAAKNAILERENEELKLSRGKSSNVVDYTINAENVVHSIAAEPK